MRPKYTIQLNTRIIKIEDSSEIWIVQPTVQAIEARFEALGSEVPFFTMADWVDLACAYRRTT